MHPNAKLIFDFYTAFQRRDFETMKSFYHPEVTFRDPVFRLQGKQVGAMWHMLCERGKDLEITFSGIQANDEKGQVHWEAYYSFSQTGRQVHNKIDAEFEFKEGKIIRHTDHFDFHSWSSMALGLIGLVLGWTPILRKKVRSQANKSLKAFMARIPEYN